MARRKSLFGYTGQLDGVVADRNGLIRMGSGPRDITAARTRENNEEFATASKQGKVIRDALIPLRIQGQLAARMVKVVRQGMGLDETNDRGKRILSSNEARQVLPGFELNPRVNLNTLAPIRVIQEGNVLRVEKFGCSGLVVTNSGSSDSNSGGCGGVEGSNAELYPELILNLILDLIGFWAVVLLSWHPPDLSNNPMGRLSRESLSKIHRQIVRLKLAFLSKHPISLIRQVNSV